MKKMKKTLAIILSLILAAGAVASCGSKDNKKDNKDKEKDGTVVTETQKDSVDTSAFTAQGIVDSIYAQKAPLFMYGAVPVDSSDKEMFKSYLGVEDASSFSDFAVSESMIGAQAYSLVVARAAEGVDAAKLSEKMKNGIDNRKWVCVEADDVKTVTVGDLICFCMISTEYKDAFTAQDAMDAFKKVVYGEAEYIENPVDEEIIDEELPENIEEDAGIAEDEDPVFDGEVPTFENDNEETSGADIETSTEVNTSEKEEKPAENPEVNETPDTEETPVVNEKAPEAGEKNTQTETPAEETGDPAIENEPETAPETEEEPQEQPTDDNNTESEPEEAKPEEAVKSLEGIINDMYAIKSPQFMLGTIPVDMSDEFSYNTYLGIKNPAKITEAVVSEPMIGAQAYSLVIARVAPGQDANAVANEMKAGIDPRKWVCVEADDIKTAVSGDLVCFCMISTDFAEDYTAQDAIDAFKKAAK